jgi:glycosyltransferase involved in cell wall biosynthesis
MVSVVICTYNRAESLRRTLVSLSAMSVPADISWEVLVIDNNSTDGTQGAAEAFARDARITVRYVFAERQGLNHARNAGVRAAKGELIFFLDDDVEVTRDWLPEMTKAFELNPVVGVGGRVFIKADLYRPAWWHAEYDGALGKFDPGEAAILSDDTYTSIIGIGANLAFKRSAFEKYGGFRPDLDRRKRKLLMGGDVEFYQRIKKAGELTMYYPNAIVYHCPDSSRLTKMYLRRWYFRIGEWGAQKFVSGASVPTLRTVPRWKYRQVLEQLLRSLVMSLTSRRREAFYHQLQFLSLLGYFFGAAKNSVRRRRRRSFPAAP